MGPASTTTTNAEHNQQNGDSPVHSVWLLHRDRVHETRPSDKVVYVSGGIGVWNLAPNSLVEARQNAWRA